MAGIQSYQLEDPGPLTPAVTRGIILALASILLLYALAALAAGQTGYAAIRSFRGQVNGGG